jgi:hypothetical protein
LDIVKNLRADRRLNRKTNILRTAILLLASAALGQSSFAKAVGTVKSISGNTVVLTTDAGAQATVTLSDSTRILQTKPGQTDLKSATQIHASDIKVGDRVLALGPNGEENSTLASTVIVMKQGDIADKQQQEREQWRTGVGGIVKEVNAPAGTITVTNALASSGKAILIHISPATTVRRYSADSVKFDDAEPSNIDQIKPGDQLRARGEKNADGSEFTAQAIVSGTFRQIAGTVISTDPANNNITVLDLVTKKPVALKVTADSQMHKLPQFMAQRLAMTLKRGAAPGNGAPASQSGQNGAGRAWNRGQGEGSAASPSGQRPGAGEPGATGAGNWRNAGGTPDFQQILSRMPNVAVSDLQKGDAVMIVATEGSANSQPTTITLLTGVEPILTAAPSGAAVATILSPWNLGTSPGGDAASE